ncbi:hypothetical protein BJ684DRAFT_388, partial [Piptocephalis cylindrospora]
ELSLAVDVNVNNPIALQNTRMVKAYVGIDPRVRPLMLIVKRWTKQRELNDAAAGGTLSTYTWVNMLIQYLQLRDPPVLPVLQQLGRPQDDRAVHSAYFYDDLSSLQNWGKRNEEGLGRLLYGFFHFYTHTYTYARDVVSVRMGRFLTRKEKGWHEGRHARILCVEEPFTEWRNLGNSADDTSVHGIQEELRRAQRIL